MVHTSALTHCSLGNCDAQMLCQVHINVDDFPPDFHKGDKTSTEANGKIWKVIFKKQKNFKRKKGGNGGALFIQKKRRKSDKAMSMMEYG